MHILGIETSCDETAAAVVTDGHHVRSSIVASQIDRHAPYGGVIPELAAREHLRAIDTVAESALAEAGLRPEQLDAVAVTNEPGLLTALLVGISYAKGLSAALDVPLIGVNHITAHIYGSLMDHPQTLHNPTAYPMVALVVSGGHTLLILLSADGTCQIIGRTLDDAAGEAFDKAAKILDLPYPGGPVIDRLARQGDRKRFAFPQGLTGGAGTAVKPEHRLDFSYSGVKTALLYHVRSHAPERLAADLAPPVAAAPPGPATDQDILDAIASYQEAVVEVLARKLSWAARDHRARTLLLCGGVACNSRLRELCAQRAEALTVPLIVAPPKYCTDNAAMIAGLACHLYQAGNCADFHLDANARLKDLGRIPATAR